MIMVLHTYNSQHWGDEGIKAVLYIVILLRGREGRRKVREREEGREEGRKELKYIETEK